MSEERARAHAAMEAVTEKFLFDPDLNPEDYFDNEDLDPFSIIMVSNAITVSLIEKEVVSDSDKGWVSAAIACGVVAGWEARKMFDGEGS